MGRKTKWTNDDIQFIQKVLKFYSISDIANYTGFSSSRSLRSRLTYNGINIPKIKATRVKQCSCCNRWLLMKDFDRDIDTVDGLSNECNECKGLSTIDYTTKVCHTCNRRLPSINFTTPHTQKIAYYSKCFDCCSKIRPIKPIQLGIRETPKSLKHDTFGRFKSSSTKDYLTPENLIKVKDLVHKSNQIKHQLYTSQNTTETKELNIELRSIHDDVNFITEAMIDEIREIRRELHYD